MVALADLKIKVILAHCIFFEVHYCKFAIMAASIDLERVKEKHPFNKEKERGASVLFKGTKTNKGKAK